MGLDIMLRRFAKEADYTDGTNGVDYHTVDETDIERFKKLNMEHLICKRGVEYFDVEVFGITDDFKWCSTTFGDEGYPVHNMMDTKHELYELYEKVSNIDLPKVLPSEIEIDTIFTPEELALIKKSGYDGPLVQLSIGGYATLHSLCMFLNNKIRVTFHMKDCPVVIKTVDVFYTGEEIGYQRKGLNGNFYDEFTEEDYMVLTKERMQYVYDNYVLDDYKEHFKERLLDKFVDGETYCIYSW